MEDSQAIGFKVSSIYKLLGDLLEEIACLEKAPTTQQEMTLANVPKTSFGDVT
jgi:hypothetical protein